MLLAVHFESERERGGAVFAFPHHTRDFDSVGVDAGERFARLFSLVGDCNTIRCKPKENKRSDNQQRFSTEEGAYDGVRLTHCVGAETGVQSEPVEGVDQAVLLFLNNKTERSSFSNKHR